MISQIKFIDEVRIKRKKILIRVDFNVSLLDGFTIADDARIKQVLPTIKYLLQNKNRLILISHLDRPKKRDPRYSLKIILKRLRELLPHYSIGLVDDFLSPAGKEQILNQKGNQILLLENIRFYKEELNNNPTFAKELSKFADIYVNDAFAVSHRSEASIVSVPAYIPSYGGLLLKKETQTILKTVQKKIKPFVAIVGGAKIETKIDLIGKLTEIADYVLIGGGIANTFLCAHGYEIGKSYCEYEKVSRARQLLFLAAQKHTAIVLPSDVVVGKPENKENGGAVKKVDEISSGSNILDIGPETQAHFGSIIAKAKTIVWNGPVGYIENPLFKRGTDFIYYSITHNRKAISIVGGGDTIVAISKEEYLEKITHISTGGGAMLEYIQNGTLPGIEALKQKERYFSQE